LTKFKWLITGSWGRILWTWQ